MYGRWGKNEDLGEKREKEKDASKQNKRAIKLFRTFVPPPPLTYPSPSPPLLSEYTYALALVSYAIGNSATTWLFAVGRGTEESIIDDNSTCNRLDDHRYRLCVKLANDIIINIF